MARLVLGLLLLAACSRPDRIEGRWLVQSDAFIPRGGRLPADSVLARAVLRPRTNDTLLLATDGRLERRLAGQQTSGRWNRSGDTLRFDYPGGTTDTWRIWRLASDTLVISPAANPALVRVYVRMPGS